MKAIFFEPSYEVTTLPSYAPDVGSNPFVAFAPIPARSRYRFMLDEAQLALMGFIKGPVCRGQLALNAIEDQFWVFFADPDSDPRDVQDRFLKEGSAQPGPAGGVGQQLADRHPMARVPASPGRVHDGSHFLEKELAPLKIDVSLIWDGDGVNPNAALTVVAGYDVFGNIGHHLNTRLYMDFLRMEAESNFLVLLPRDSRKPLRDSWYPGASDGAYPNALYVVPHTELPALVAAMAGLASEADYTRLADRFAIRRTNPDFWRHADALRAAHAISGEGHHGILDLSRFENR